MPSPASTDQARFDAARVVLERLASLDEHVVESPHHEVLGEAVRAVAIVPAHALGALDPAGTDWRESTRKSLAFASALLVRFVLSARAQDVPTAGALLDMVDRNPMGKGNAFIDKDPLWGRVAWISWLFGELAHVADSLEADCYGALAALHHCLEFMVALSEGGELAAGQG